MASENFPKGEIKMHTTNYYNTFIEVAEDCPVRFGEVPAQKTEKKTVATLEFEMLHNHPYEFTSDDILFRVYAVKNDIDAREHQHYRSLFFSKGQPCFRASPLTKRYGWGIHFDEAGKMAIYSVDAPEYAELLKDKKISKLKAMRSVRK